ncbi:proton/phosphate symporter [Monoraphidium neglectum]|uniref:Proton/phosphate symporter n=1 Tax=Monoraphidium neglectum TaxID=145388 RepID=A0A0D2KBT2_9CHLO|nr:proton/phosphate symporter [Monoraphidium neglectum]KIY93363.1 proton/phosphate symporter [Monoraphidium neglectum]|eukprot:XP_013892383.1 proton/phosphate symporter [Monoraphidium neglectum]
MLLFGALGDFMGRAWGSRIVASIMLSGSILLVMSPLVSDPLTYLRFFIFAQTFYGFGVGGEYPMASSSAAERSQSDPALRNRRGEQVVLTFSQQGMGNLVNGCVILIFMVIFAQTGKSLEPTPSRNIIMLQFAAAAAVSVFMVLWRYLKLKESEVWKAEREDALELTAKYEHQQTSFIYRTALKRFWPRLLVTSLAWVANDGAFYGNKLFQSKFIEALYPNVRSCAAEAGPGLSSKGRGSKGGSRSTPFERMQWTVLNSAVSLTGYWAAAALIDKPWYGRRFMQ